MVIWVLVGSAPAKLCALALFVFGGHGGMVCERLIDLLVICVVDQVLVFVVSV